MYLAGFGGSLREKLLRDAKSLKREGLKPDRGTPAFAQGFGAAGTDVTNQDCRGRRVGCESESYPKSAGDTPATTDFTSARARQRPQRVKTGLPSAAKNLILDFKLLPNRDPRGGWWLEHF